MDNVINYKNRMALKLRIYVRLWFDIKMTRCAQIDKNRRYINSSYSNKTPCIWKALMDKIHTDF